MHAKSDIRRCGKSAARLTAFLLFVLLAAFPIHAREEIRSFDTVFEVHSDASVTIRETIVVNAEDRSIRRGIFRDIPTTLVNAEGRQIILPLTVASVSRNGMAEPYTEEAIGDGRRIRIGSADVLLPRGEHSYEIVYTMERAARFFGEYDEFYWNATGNYWEFPILAASALVVLPDGADIIEVNVYSEGAALAERSSDNEARFILTEPLAPREGMTVSVAFHKGVLVAPEGMDAAVFWLSDYRDIIAPLLMLVLVIGFNGLAWNAVGRDPEKGVIFPRFHPPHGFSPALINYVHHMGWGGGQWLAYSAALISLAVKGLIEIDKPAKKTTFTLTGKEPDKPLPSGEAVVFSDIKRMAPVSIDKKSGPKFSKSRSEFIKAIERENRSVYFNHNLLYVVVGVVLGLGCLVGMVLLGILDPLFVVIAAFAAVFLSLLTLGTRSIWQGKGIGRFFAIGMIVFMTANLGTLILDAGDMNWFDFPFVAAISIIAITLVFAILMRAPTVHGRKVMDEIDGFKMYLDTAEKERLNFQDEPEMTVARFEAILPYAMALGVEKPWSERFEKDLARNAVRDAGKDYAPNWYHGGNFSSGSLSRAMGGVASGLSSAMISAQPASSSSTGVGGGGFSGGGGGGGGGGGW